MDSCLTEESILAYSSAYWYSKFGLPELIIRGVVMNLFRTIALGLLLAWGVVSPMTLSAQAQQSSSSAPGSALNEPQRTGKRLFLQNCALCHVPEPKNTKDPKDKGTTVGKPMEILYRGETPRPEAVVRSFIEQGVEGKMPGFRYGLEPKEIDAIIAYLKTL